MDLDNEHGASNGAPSWKVAASALAVLVFSLTAVLWTITVNRMNAGEVRDEAQDAMLRTHDMTLVRMDANLQMLLRSFGLKPLSAAAPRPGGAHDDEDAR